LADPGMDHFDDIATDFTLVDLQFHGHVITLPLGRLSGSRRLGFAAQAGDGCG